MNFLLDTHTAIWFITDDDRLPEKLKTEISKPDNECFVSIATFWEMGIKFSLGKLTLHVELDRIFEIFFETGFQLLSIKPEHIIINSKLDFYHRDPFDRIIISQAIHENFTILSADELFKKYDVSVSWG